MKTEDFILQYFKYIPRLFYDPWIFCGQRGKKCIQMLIYIYVDAMEIIFQDSGHYCLNIAFEYITAKQNPFHKT